MRRYFVRQSRAAYKWVRLGVDGEGLRRLHVAAILRHARRDAPHAGHAAASGQADTSAHASLPRDEAVQLELREEEEHIACRRDARRTAEVPHGWWLIVAPEVRLDGKQHLRRAP